MQITASLSVVLLGAGCLFAAQPPAVPPSSEPAGSHAAGPQLDDFVLPQPRVAAPRPIPSTPIVEEPAPAPHERPNGSISPVPLGQFREEMAPMPREQSPMPTRYFMPGAARDPSVPDVESLHREIEALKMEREAMLVEEMDLTTAKDLRESKKSEANLRKRLTELLVRVAEQSRKAKEPASASPPVRSRGNEKNRETAASNRTPATSAPGADASNSPNPSVPAAQPLPFTHTGEAAKQPGDSAKVVTDAPVDPLALAQSLFRTGDYVAALNAYRKLDQEQQKPEERVAIQYMMACCLRKLGKTGEASVLYREVANTAGNDFLSENAQWYLRTMKERRELEEQLAELRQRRQAVMPRKP